MSNRVVHFEIPCDDPEKTMKFFSEVFQWSFHQYGDNEYWLAITGDDKEQGINGGIMKKKDPNQPLANSIMVESIDLTINKIESSGGTVVVPKMPLPGMGWLAYFKDPDGNIHGLWEDDSKI